MKLKQAIKKPQHTIGKDNFNENRSDSRILLFRHVSSKYIKGKGWKLSISLHPYWFYWLREFREFRLTVLGLNIHFRRK